MPTNTGISSNRGSHLFGCHLYSAWTVAQYLQLFLFPHRLVVGQANTVTLSFYKIRKELISMTWPALLGGEMKSFDSQIFRAKMRDEGILSPKQIRNLFCYSGLVPLCYSVWEEFRWNCPTTKCFASESCSIACLLMGQSLLLCFSLRCNSHQYVFCLSVRPHSWTRRDMHPLLI